MKNIIVSFLKENKKIVGFFVIIFFIGAVDYYSSNEIVTEIKKENEFGNWFKDLTITQEIVYLVIGWYIVLPLVIFLPTLFGGFYFAGKMKNTPYVKDKEGNAIPGPSGLFTSLPPGIVKIIVRGDTPIYFLMDFLGHMFRKFKEEKTNDLEDDSDRPESDYQVVTGTTSRIRDILPFPRIFFGTGIVSDWFLFHIRILWWIWKVLIYKWSGLIFTGIPDWQTVRTYKLEYLKLKDGQLVTQSTYSDQFRVMKFDVYVKVPAVETKDNVKLEITIHLVCRVVNPWLTAFGVPQSEGWYNRISGILSSVVRDFYRKTEYQQTLSDTSRLTISMKSLGEINPTNKKKGTEPEEVKEETEPEEVKEETKEETKIDIGTPIADIGIEIISAAIYNQSIVSEDLAKSLSAIAVATADAKARSIGADAEAYANAKISSTMKDPNAQTVYDKEATIRTIKAAPKGAIVTIDTTGNNKNNEDSTILKGILSELRTKKENKEE